VVKEGLSFSLGGVGCLLGDRVEPDPRVDQLVDVQEESRDRREEILIALPSQSYGEDMAVVRLEDLLALVQQAEAHHGLLLCLAHLAAISLQLEMDLLARFEIHSGEKVGEKLLDLLVSSHNRASLDLSQVNAFIHLVVDLSASLINQVIPHHAHVHSTKSSVGVAGS